VRFLELTNEGWTTSSRNRGGRISGRLVPPRGANPRIPVRHVPVGCIHNCDRTIGHIAMQGYFLVVKIRAEVSAGRVILFPRNVTHEQERCQKNRRKQPAGSMWLGCEHRVMYKALEGKNQTPRLQISALPTKEGEPVPVRRRHRLIHSAGRAAVRGRIGIAVQPSMLFHRR